MRSWRTRQLQAVEGRRVTRASNVRASTTPNTAIASSPATRDTALLTPDATPACGGLDRAHHRRRQRRHGDRHAESEHHRPRERTSSSTSRRFPAGRTARSRRAAIAGPTVSGSRLPMRATSPPDQRDSANMMSGNGSSAAPAAVAV